MPLLGEQALDPRVKAASSPAILHLSTHGFFLECRPLEPDDSPSAGMVRLGEGGIGRTARLAAAENPLLRAGLALAGAQTWLNGGTLPDEAGDGLLTAEDVTGMDLTGTELVVLSACDTGLGEIRTGEGVFGLRRAFAIAGARTLVMSLWKVDDEVTHKLMAGFYRHLLAGAGRAEALRQAQMEIRDDHPHPCYWAGFICQGDPNPLPQPLTASSAEPSTVD